MRHKWYLWVLMAGFLCGLAGCNGNESASVGIDFQKLDWKVVVIIVGALLTPFQQVLQPFLRLLQPVVVLLQKIGLIKPPVDPDATPDELTIAELIAILTDLLAKTKDENVKAQLLGLISTAASVDVSLMPAAAKAVASAESV